MDTTIVLTAGHVDIDYDADRDRIYIQVDGTSQRYVFEGPDLEAWRTVLRRAVLKRNNARE